MDSFEILLAFLVGSFLIFLLLFVVFRAQKKLLLVQFESDTKLFDERLESKNLELQKLEEIQKKSDERINQLLEDKGLLREKVSEVETKLVENRKSHLEQVKAIEESREKLKLEFKDLADKIFEQNSKRISVQNKQGLELLLNPLKDEIGKFKKQITETYEKETRERFSLKNEIGNLQKLNEKMSQETVNLTNALKGDVKQQGAWGEIVLERILESSGLQKDREYFTQFSLKNEDGQLLRPDVVVRLPDDKDVIIDSKVSLVSYEKFSSEINQELKKQHAKNHIISVKNHIRSLSLKSYQDLPELRTLDYVLLFMPLEGAFRLALEEDESLLIDAMKKNVMLVGPSTLLVSLKTIHRLWQYEHQSQHAKVIAKKAELLHRKFVLFVQELQKVGDALNSAGKHYDEAFKRLSTGRGNLIKLSTDLQELGVKSKDDLPKELLKLAEVEDHQLASPVVQEK